jgi:hypothetical protein
MGERGRETIIMRFGRDAGVRQYIDALKGAAK